MLLTESGRQNLLLTVTVLALVCFFSSFLLFVSAAYVKITIDSKMRLLETYNSDVLPGIFIFVGLVNLIQNVVVVIVSYRLMTIDMRDQLVPTLVYILIGGIVLVIFEVASAIASFVHISILDSEFGEGLNKAMNKYIEGGELKREMDSVQMIYSCCGDRSYVDWFRYQWIEPESLRTYGTSVKKYLHADGKYFSDDAPFSCCDPQSPRPCIHHHIHDNKRHHAYNVNVETTLYVAGCRATLMSIYGHVLLTVGLIATIIACVKTSVLLLFRLLQTSLSKAQQYGDWEATTNGYIYKDDPDAEEGMIKITDQDEGNTTEAETTEAETTEGEESTAPEDRGMTSPEEGDITASEGGDTVDAEGGDMMSPGDEASTVAEDEGAQDENENRRYARRMYKAAQNLRNNRSFKRNRNVSCRTKQFHESERSRQLTEELCHRFLFPGKHKLDESFSEGALDIHTVENVRRHLSSRTSLTTDDQRSMTSLPTSARKYGNRCRSNNNCHEVTEDSTVLSSSCDERSEGRHRGVATLALNNASEPSGNRNDQSNNNFDQGGNPRTSRSFEDSFHYRQMPGWSFHVENEEREATKGMRTCQDKGCKAVRATSSSSSYSTSSTSSTNQSSASMCSTSTSSQESTSSEDSSDEAPDETTDESRVQSNAHLKSNLGCSLDERREYMSDQRILNQGCLMGIDQKRNFNHGYMPDIDQGNVHQDYLTDIDRQGHFNPGYTAGMGQGDFSARYWADLNHREICHGHQNDANGQKDKPIPLTNDCQQMFKKRCHVTGSGQRFLTNEDVSQKDTEESDEERRQGCGPSIVLYFSNEAYNKAFDRKPETGESFVALKHKFSLEPPSQTSFCNSSVVKTREDFLVNIDDEAKPIDMLDDLEVSEITMGIPLHQTERNVKSSFPKKLDDCGGVEKTDTEFFGNITRMDASVNTTVVYKPSNRKHVRSFCKQNKISHLPVVESTCRLIRLPVPSSLPGAPGALCVSGRYPALDPLAKNAIDDQCNSDDRKNDRNSADCETANASFGQLMLSEKPNAAKENVSKEVSDCTSGNVLPWRVLISPFN